MEKQYEISANRRVIVRNNEGVTIEEPGSKGDGAYSFGFEPLFAAIADSPDQKRGFVIARPSSVDLEQKFVKVFPSGS